ncbi:MAG: molybdopterin-synthase adenylyltransferase MoeB [Verrucomicrobia bacterium]|nr:molybdopterin-synthase adenylyltransferase MoeB [Verrucomicrobiota bacterium]
MPLDHDQLRRYARHLTLRDVGVEGQTRICSARVLCVGAGGLGSPAAMYLAAAGVGRLGIVDGDAVDVSNLQRQILHGTPDLGRSKADSAKAMLQRLNPQVEVVSHAVRLTRANAPDLIQPYDIVVDGTDNFPARYLVNEACVLLGKPCVYGAVSGWEGQASVLAPHLGGPCYRCLYPEPPPPETVPAGGEPGVLGALPGILGCIQATETLKLILGRGTPLIGRLLLVNALDMRFREVNIRRDPQCPVCGAQPGITAPTDAPPAGGATAPAPAAGGREAATAPDIRQAPR